MGVAARNSMGPRPSEYLRDVPPDAAHPSFNPEPTAKASIPDLNPALYELSSPSHSGVLLASARGRIAFAVGSGLNELGA